MSATTINIDDNTKKEAQELLKDMGMNLSTAVNVFLKQLVKEQRIPFEIGNPRPSQELLEALREVEKMKKKYLNLFIDEKIYVIWLILDLLKIEQETIKCLKMLIEF